MAAVAFIASSRVRTVKANPPKDPDFRIACVVAWRQVVRKTIVRMSSLFYWYFIRAADDLLLVMRNVDPEVSCGVEETGKISDQIEVLQRCITKDIRPALIHFAISCNLSWSIKKGRWH